MTSRNIAWIIRSPARILTVSVLIVVLYNNWILAPLFNPSVSWRYTLISEISARTQPFHWLFQTLDISAGLLTLAMLPLIVKFLRQTKLVFAVLLVAAFGFIGLDSIVDASLPISCAPTIDAHCSLLANNSIITTAHLAESTIAGVLTFAAPCVWWYMNRRKRSALVRFSWSFVCLQVIVGLAIVLGRLIHHDVTGYLQRIYELSIGGWIAAVTHVSGRRLVTKSSTESPEVYNVTLLEE